MNVGTFQVYQTTGTQKYVQLADLTPSGGQLTLTVPASGFVTPGSWLSPMAETWSCSRQRLREVRAFESSGLAPTLLRNAPVRRWWSRKRASRRSHELAS